MRSAKSPQSLNKQKHVPESRQTKIKVQAKYVTVTSQEVTSDSVKDQKSCGVKEESSKS